MTTIKLFSKNGFLAYQGDINVKSYTAKNRKALAGFLVENKDASELLGNLNIVYKRMIEDKGPYLKAVYPTKEKKNYLKHMKMYYYGCLADILSIGLGFRDFSDKELAIKDACKALFT